MVEEIGSCIERINDEIAWAGLPFPQFKTEGKFTVKFKRPSNNLLAESREKTREKIISPLKENKDITTVELPKTFGITEKMNWILFN